MELIGLLVNWLVSLTAKATVVGSIFKHDQYFCDKHKYLFRIGLVFIHLYKQYLPTCAYMQTVSLQGYSICLD